MIYAVFFWRLRLIWDLCILSEISYLLVLFILKVIKFRIPQFEVIDWNRDKGSWFTYFEKIKDFSSVIDTLGNVSFSYFLGVNERFFFYLTKSHMRERFMVWRNLIWELRILSEISYLLTSFILKVI